MHFLFVFVNSIVFVRCLNQTTCNRGKTDGETKKIKERMFFSTKMFLIWTKSTCKFFRRFVCWKTWKKQVATHKKSNQILQVFVLFFLFRPSLRNTYSANIFRWLAPFYVNCKELPKGAYIKYVGGVGPEGFTIFLKVFRSLGDHRPKHFMAQ